MSFRSSHFNNGINLTNGLHNDARFAPMASAEFGAETGAYFLKSVPYPYPRVAMSPLVSEPMFVCQPPPSSTVLMPAGQVNKSTVPVPRSDCSACYNKQ